MNWRNPFLNAYLAVTVIGAGLLGYFLYSSYSRYSEVSATYDTQVAQLQKLQNKVPFPSEENNRAYAALTEEYRAETEKLLAKVTKMQKPVEAITPQTFQDRLRTYVSEVMAAAKLNGVTVDESFYLGFDKYRDQLPSNEAAGVLARELDAIRLVVDQLINFKVREIRGIRRDALPEEGGAASRAPEVAQSPGRRPPGGGGQGPGGGGGNAPRIVSANSFDVAFVSDQNRLRQILNAIVTSNQFFIIRNLAVENSSLEGPKRVDPATANAPGGATPSADPAAPAAASMRLLVGRETLSTVLRIEMITFTPPDSKK